MSSNNGFDDPYGDLPPEDPYAESQRRMVPGEGEERIVLGAMMQSDEVIGDILDILKGDDFYRPRHTTIFTAILHLYGNGEPSDPVAVAGQLIAAGDISRVGGVAYLHDCVTAVPTASQAAYYARKVADLATRRRIVTAGSTIALIGNNHSMDLLAARSGAEQVLWDATMTDQEKNGLQPIASFVDETLDEIWAAGSRDGLIGSSTGYHDLDELTGGYRPGQLITVAGRPGMGKSVCAIDAARANAISDGKVVAFFSLEMAKSELLTRIFAAEARLRLSDIAHGTLREDDKEHLREVAARVRNAPLHIDDTPAMSVTDIRSRAVRISRQNPGHLGLVVVDYLQLLSPSRKTDNRQQEIADATRALKLLAKELKVPVIAVAQLNRNVEQRADKRPVLADLRESGAIEQDSDIVVLIHREDYYDKEHVRAGEADLIVAKHRGGPTDTVTLAALLHQARFGDMAVGL